MKNMRRMKNILGMNRLWVRLSLMMGGVVFLVFFYSIPLHHPSACRSRWFYSGAKTG